MTATAATPTPLKPGEKRRYIVRVQDREGNHPIHGDDWWRVHTADNPSGQWATRKWAQDVLDAAKASYRFGTLMGFTDDIVIPAPGPTLETIRVSDWLLGNVVPVANVPLAYRAIYRDTLHRAALAAYRFGHPIWVNESFRTRAQQEHFYDLYINHGGALAAIPGTSPHERGIGLDIPNARIMPGLIVELRKLGLIDDVPSEIWHVTNHNRLVRKVAGEPRAFDWLSRHDDRSRQYAVADVMAERVAPLETRIWETTVTLDQGREGACTGFGTAHEINAAPDEHTVDAALAQMLYHRAKQLDEYPGEDYEGSSVLAAVKAASEQGFYTKGYRWAFGEKDLARAVSELGPAIIGVPWLEEMSEPDDDGYLHAAGEPVGGHCLLVKGIDVERDAYLLHNSWGPSWGLDGDAWISRADMALLLADHGEACIPNR